MSPKERWVRVGTHTFRLDCALRFHELTDEQGALTGLIRVVLGNRDRFTLDREASESLRRFIADELRPTTLDPDSLRYTGGSPGPAEPGPQCQG